ncbi:DNA primase [Alphaproteobacteria bacterium LSUCC0684]
MALPQHFMDELRRRTTISSVVGRHVKLNRRGNRLIGLCPFHNEKTPSFHVRDDEGFYHCFGCGVSGDAISFLREKEGLGFMEAVRTLADMAGLAVPQSTPEEAANTEKRTSQMVILDETARQYQSALAEEGNPAKAYLERRGIGEEMIREFRLGYAKPRGLTDAMARFGHSPEAMIEAGVARRSERDQRIYDYFRNRVMFPICDMRGRVIAFGARALSDDQQPKYLNSGESQLFHKKAVLYGAHLARVAARKNLPLVVCEGYMDVIAIHQAGVAAAVAPLGTALTEDQIKLLWRMDEQPQLCFDGDNAGRGAALKALIRALPLLEPGKSFRLILLPPGRDPDDILREEGINAFKGLIAGSISFLDGLWNGLLEGRKVDDPASRAAFWQDIRQHIRQIGNGQMRASMGDEVERRIAEMRQESRGNAIFSGYRAMRSSKRPTLQSDPRARVILSLLVEHPVLVQDFYEQISMLKFDDEMMEKLRQTVINAIIMNSTLDENVLRQHLSEYGFEHIRGNTLLDGIKARVRFDPSAISLDEARARLSEVIKLEVRKVQSGKSHADLRKPS